MAAEVDPKIIQKTQDLLGSVIKKPPLHDKLLKKPPFRFLHDIITNVIKTTQFFEGLYSPEDMVSDNVKDKESKMAFLQKAIDVVAMATGVTLTARPSKIVAGHEPEKTNEFLQVLAKAIAKKSSSKDAVQRVLKGEKPGKTSQPVKSDVKGTLSVPTKKREGKEKGDKSVKPTTKAPSQRRKSTDTKASKEAEHQRKKTVLGASNGMLESPVKHNDLPAEVIDQPGPAEVIAHVSEVQNDRRVTSHTGRSRDKTKSARQRKGSDTIGADESERLTTMEESSANSRAEKQETDANVSALQMEELQSPADVDPKLDAVARPPSPKPLEDPPKHMEQKHTAHVTESPKAPKPMPPRSAAKPDIVPNTMQAAEVAENSTSSSSRSLQSAVRPMRSARPVSARPAAPKIRVRKVDMIEQARLMSAKPVENVILDTQQQEDDDETFVVEDKPDEADDILQQNIIAPPSSDDHEEEQKGSLVKQLLETKKDLEGGSQQISNKKAEIDKMETANVGRKKERETTDKAVAQLREFIQLVSRSANPLGKMLDYLQEDIDTMQHELQTWREEHQQNLQALFREQSATEAVLEPLRSQLEDLDQAIQDQLDRISALKSSILRNDDRISRMLASVNLAVRP